jgi:colanic acid biosynthesis glycosyl transferase WcaI
VRILLLNLYYPPDTSATAKMAEAVVNALREKHQVTIVCGRPSYDPTERRVWRLWHTEYGPQSAQRASVKIIRVGSTDYPRARMWRRVANYLSYVALSVPLSLFVGCDLVLGMTDPPFEGIVAAFVAMLKRKPYVYNIRDLYPDMAVAGSIVEAGAMSRVWEVLHRWALRRAGRVITLGDDMRARVIAKGVDAKRITVARDGVANSGGTDDSEIDTEVIQAIRKDFRFVLVHAGNLGFYGAWQTLLNAMDELKSETIGLVFVGDGAQREQMRHAANGRKHVRFLPFFPANKIASVLAAGDVHVVTIRRGLEGVIVPSKMYGILAAGKPILAVAPREADVACLGEKQGFAKWADPENPSNVSQAIRELCSDPERLGRMSSAARKTAQAYGRVNELQKFVQAIEEAGGSDSEG